MSCLAFLLCFGLVVTAPVDLQAKYPFSSVLLDQGGQYYALYWNFTRSTESIYFAVNVSTTGWVGFGLSPNGQMPGSDVVIGWVSNTGQTYLADRYAESSYRVLPVIDAVSQDWFLTNSEEANGYTVLEFSRNFTSCDPQDLDITSSTARVVWSFNRNDPTDPSGSDAVRHDYKGSRSLNLIGGMHPSGSIPLPGTHSLDITVTNVTIPSDSTTYWCATFQLPEKLRVTTNYISRISPAITPHVSSFVHHILVYFCRQPLSANDVGASGVCDDLSDDINRCRQGVLIGGWAVGGEDFVYPDGIAYPIGGTGQDHFVIIEMHYDNPNRMKGVVDSSGMRFYYTTKAPAQNAGIMFFGHEVTPTMLIPPGNSNYTISGICSANCTSSFLPDGGIRIFANILHTHLAGRGLTIQHFRHNPECGGLEELEPIDQNLNYDFNFQQFVHLPKEHVVLPGDILVLKCYYDSSNRSRVVVGGLATTEEMCLSFPVFYPRAPDGSSLVKCVSMPDLSMTFSDFVRYVMRVNPSALLQLIKNPGRFMDILDSLDWAGDPQLTRILQESVLNNAAMGSCTRENGQNIIHGGERLPEPTCPYHAPNQCNHNTDQPATMTDEVAGDEVTGDEVTGGPLTDGTIKLKMTEYVQLLLPCVIHFF